MKSKILKYSLIIIFMLMIVVGIYLVKTNQDPQGIMKVIPYFCIGIGCGLFGQSMGNILYERNMRANPEIYKKIQIEKNDERNIAIAQKAKSKAFDMMIFVFGALILSFGLMGIDTIALLLLIFTYLFVQGCALWYNFKLQKEI